MSLFEDTNARELKMLLSEIHSRVAVLPDFQRDFVWDPSATQELIVSIANNYPAGSILRVRDTKRLFACREFEGAPSLDGAKHTFLVLDGQQRLTSLYQAFYGVGDHRYYLDIKKLMSGADFEEAISHERAATKRARFLERIENQAAELVLPLAVLKGGTGKFTQWSRTVARALPDTERIALEDALDGIEERWINVIDDYKFPVVTLSEETKADALCTIFETLNRTGVKLNVFELLTARFWSASVNLRELWERAKLEHPLIEEYEVDPYYVLQGIAVVGREKPSCKRSDVLKLEAADIEKWWSPVVRGLATGLQVLRDDCGVVVPKWLPYGTMLIPLSAVLARAPLPKGPSAGARRELLKRWFWCSSFGQAYESASNSQAARDFTELLSWFEGGDAPEAVRKFRFDPRALRDVTPRQRTLYKSAICAVLANRALDFHKGDVITAKLVAEEEIDDHHIFPDHFLEKTLSIADWTRRNCILNRTLIDRTTNQLISARAPSDYMTEIRKEREFPFDKVLSSHMLPTGGDAPFWKDDFESFIAWRQERLWAEIQRLTGASVAADLEADADEAA